MPEPRERPLIFAAPKVRYILGLPVGATFQTRRIVHRPERFANIRDCGFLSPCGVPGDRVWGRETYVLVDDASDWIPRERMGLASPVKGAHGRRSVTWRAVYRADGELHHPVTGRLKWASPRFMPRFASRILTELVETRVQRLQEIREKDALAEGFASVFEQFPTMHHKQSFASRAGDGAQLERFADRPRAASFAIAWDEINDQRAPWVSNPWVWSYTLRKLEAPHA